MIKRLENWLRRIFSEELKRTETLFEEDRERFMVGICDALAGAITQLNTDLRETITADLKQFRADCVAERLLVAAPQHWKVNDEVHKADKALIRPKPARR